ncbi:cytochrome P450 [Actinocrispum sp. NPDC049592]|uniref:cytochrome P450 n=1 Tax=Actinocrispum sp. NPDC049592 TaxID=3154835 RepID=UPI0034410FB0
MTVQALPVAPRRVPLLGHVLSLARDPIAFLQQLRAHGEIVTFYLATRPVHLVNSPDLIRKVLVTEAHHFQRGEIFTKARQLFGDGLATADEPEHMRQRRMIQPAFHAQRIKSYVAVMREQVGEITGSWVSGTPIRLDHELTRLTLLVTAKALFSAELGRSAVDEVCRSLGPVLNGLAKRTMIPVELLERLPTPGNRKFDTALHRLTTVVDDVITAYRADGVDHGDLLSMLIATEGLSDGEIRTQVLNLLMAGTETTATTLAWVFHELGRNPVVLGQVVAELQTVLNGQPVDADRLSELTYINRVLTETVRLHTPIWLVTRKTTAEVRLGDVTLAPGSEVMVSMPTLHRDPALFPGPMRFDPDRWLEPAARDSFIPFGAGAHKCVGDRFAWAEMAVVVAGICTRWHLRPRPGRPVREVARAFLRPSSLPMIPVAR